MKIHFTLKLSLFYAYTSVLWFLFSGNIIAAASSKAGQSNLTVSFLLLSEIARNTRKQHAVVLKNRNTMLCNSTSGTQIIMISIYVTFIFTDAPANLPKIYAFASLQTKQLEAQIS